MMKEDGMQIGRFKVRKLMREMNLISKQPSSHAYKKATVERPDIPNVLNREFNVHPRTRSGAVTLRTSGLKTNGTIWRLSAAFVPAVV